MREYRPHAQGAARPALAIRELTVDFQRRSGLLRTVDKVSLDVWPKEIVGVIGESGSGKTMTALSAMRLLPHGAKIGGAIALGGRDLVNIGESEMRALRGDRIALIPQDAMQSLNPTMRVGRQVGEPYEFHRKQSYGAIWSKVVELLRAVKIADPETRVRDYPHQFSGGMQQRAMIAMGLALDPELIIADEPTTALDVTVQARILKLLRDIRDERGSAILFITHELGIVAELCDWVYVMKDGKVVEDGPVKRIFEAPKADYTRMLLEATPSIHRRKGAKR
ncbi:ABC transporter ATP-binding protein [Aestuariivirga sp. YIM B02566]|uniref:ABC transporter ATP-binding protein n=1 Tax=Taklimakanibacter albus TaxID=2800327 RepID=A0ACC5RBI6_9HYPH|nr:ABC transporter ATP-binding protein [Aestuariivirga sp. YIM B02566]MBK1869994.1 ABC transporter ATP-binding protein [Aestuariivirga sp. YIM B02566]